MNETIRPSRRLLTRLAVFVAALAAVITAGFFLSAGTSSAQTCTYTNGTADCNGWTFDYFMASGSVSPTGLTLRNIEYNGDSVMFQANFVGLPVEYDNNVCGPYVDLFSEITNSSPTGVQSSEFSQGGSDWLELGAHYQIGQYVLYTAFYFSDDGEMNMRMFARGLQCFEDHVHYPIFVMDVDLEGQTTLSQGGNLIHGPGDEVYYNDGTQWLPQTVEADNYASQMGHDWIVRDPDSTMTVSISHDPGTFTPAEQLDVPDPGRRREHHLHPPERSASRAGLAGRPD